MVQYLGRNWVLTLKNFKDIIKNQREYQVNKIRDSTQPVTSTSPMKDGTKLADGIFAYQNEKEKLSFRAFWLD